MKCRQAQNLMGAYLYGDLAPEEMRELRVHAQDCTICREDLATRGRIVSSLSDSVPSLGDADKQRIMWSVKGATRKPKVKPRSLAWRLAPVLGLVFIIMLAGFVAGRFLTRSPRVTVARAHSNKLPTAVVEIQEKTPKVDDKTNPLIQQGIGILNSLAPSATVNGPNRGDATGRHISSNERSSGSSKDNVIQMAPEQAHKPQTVPDNNVEAPKESGQVLNNIDAGMDSEQTKLPRVTDPKNAETTPSDAQ